MSVPNRIHQLRACLGPLGVDAILLTHSTDISYLTRYDSHDAWLLVTRKETFYITDARYIDEVMKVMDGVVPVKFDKSLFEDVARICFKLGIKTLGLDEQHLTIQHFRRLDAFGGKKLSFKAVDGAMDALRSVKDAGEIRLIREALKLNLQAYAMIKRHLKPGVSEAALLDRLKAFIYQHKVGFSFDPIIASGPNSAFPHARVTTRKLRLNEPVLIDLGIDVKGYKSDLTRMFFLGKMPTSFREELAVMRQAQAVAFKAIRPGVMAKDVDLAVREFLKKYGLAEYFTHSLGHGVGVDIHESPRISATSDVVLEKGMVFTVEPGIYFPGRYGIRLEEMVLVTHKGCEVLSANYDQ